MYHTSYVHFILKTYVYLEFCTFWLPSFNSPPAPTPSLPPMVAKNLKFFCWFVKYNWLQNSVPYTLIQCLHCIFKNGTVISLVGICHHKNILHNYWLYFSYGTSHYLWLIYFVSDSLDLLISLVCFIFPPSSPLVTASSLGLWLCFYLVMFIHLFCFLDSIYKLNRTVFVFLWLF